MREFWDSFKKNITFEKIIVRLIMAWLLTAIVFFLKSGDTFNSAAFAADINFTSNKNCYSYSLNQNCKIYFDKLYKSFIRLFENLVNIATVNPTG